MKLQKEVLGELCLVAGFSILSAANADAHTKQYSNNTEETARTESVVTAEKMPLRYFTPKQLAEGLAAAEVDDSTCNVFIEAYLAQKTPPKQKRPPTDMILVPIRLILPLTNRATSQR